MSHSHELRCQGPQGSATSKHELRVTPPASRLWAALAPDLNATEPAQHRPRFSGKTRQSQSPVTRKSQHPFPPSLGPSMHVKADVRLPALAKEKHHFNLLQTLKTVLTLAGYTTEPCGSRPPRPSSSAWRAACARRPFWTSADAPPEEGTHEGTVKPTPSSTRESEELCLSGKSVWTLSFKITLKLWKRQRPKSYPMLKLK